MRADCTHHRGVTRVTWLAAIAMSVCAANAAAQPAQAPAVLAADAADDDRWSGDAAVYTYIVPDAANYLQPTVNADRDWLHLEARFNYEEIDTGSAWVGYNFGAAGTVSWTLVPMFGAVFGDIDGVSPGYHGSVGWRKLELYSEGEYLFDADDSAGNFFYNWSELTFAPVESLWFGVVTQRTRAYQTERDIQRGLLAGFSYKRVEFVAHVFNPDDNSPTVVLAVRVGF